MSRSFRAGLLVLATTALSGCLVLQEQDRLQGDNRCVTCHGSADNPGDFIQRSAPPTNLRGATETSSRGVGAHQLHLSDSGTHAAIACGECHLVPLRVDAPGHNDTAEPAEVVFGPLATGDGGPARWDPATGTCTGYCHGSTTDAVWTRARPESERCGTCHANPPALPHPQASNCGACHDNARPDGGFVNPARHVDGVLQVNQASCSACHGAGDAGVPPPSLDGGFRGVGAHTVHLATSASTRPLQCEECHPVPAQVATALHPNGRTDIAFTGPSTQRRQGRYDTTSATCNGWCHALSTDGGASPPWTRMGPSLGCDGCHAMPPAAPHPRSTACSLCHANATPDGGIVSRALHVDGVVQENTPAACNACHGGADGAPPADLQGQTSTTVPGVGFHQSHLRPAGRVRAVQCAECHPVPTRTLEGQHTDGVNQVRLGGPATAFGYPARYEGGRCTAFCHDPSGWRTAADGGRPSVAWTGTSGGALGCGSCHGLPPPAPHPADVQCALCHQNLVGGVFNPPDSHVNGVVDFAR